MSFLKRTMLYLARKKGKTLILFLLIFTVSAFVLSCFSILYATGEVAANMRTAVGAAFHIRSSVDVSMQGTSMQPITRRLRSIRLWLNINFRFMGILLFIGFYLYTRNRYPEFLTVWKYNYLFHS